MPRALQVAGLTAFCAGLAAVALATCVLSYAGIHAIAEQGGIQARYARGYPLLIDALLVIVLAAVLALRGAGLASRILSWVTLLVVLGAAAGAEALHATGRGLPRDAAAITVAVLPWLLVLGTFVLLLAMLRHSRRGGRANAARAWQASGRPSAGGRDRHPPPEPPASLLPTRTRQPRNSAPIVPGISARLVSGAAAGAAAAAADAAASAAAWHESPGLGGGSDRPAGAEPPGLGTGSGRPAEPDPPGETSPGPEPNAPEAAGPGPPADG